MKSVIDELLGDFKERFNKDACQVIKATKSLSTFDGFKSFCTSDIDSLMDHYKDDFTSSEMKKLTVAQIRGMKYMLQNEKADGELKEMSMNDICKWLSPKSSEFDHASKLYTLVCVLPAGASSGERAFSGLKIIKNRLRSTMGDEMLDDLLTLYMEKDLLEQIMQSDEEMEKLIEMFAQVEHKSKFF